MWSAIERDVLMMNLKVFARLRKRGRRDEIEPPSLSAMAKDVVDDFARGEQFMHKYQAGAAIVYLRDAKITRYRDCAYLVLLVAISDKRRPDHVLSNPEENSRRDVPKAEREGNEHSCHVVIRLEPNNSGGYQYRLAFEHVPMFSIMYIARYLRALFRILAKQKDYEVADPDGVRTDSGVLMVKCTVVTELRAVPSDELLRDLKQGQLAEIVLRKEEDGHTGFDERKYTVEKTSTLKLKPVVKGVGAQIMDVVRSVCAAGDKRNYDSATVRWKADNRVFTARFDCDSASLLDTRYVKRHTFTLDVPLPASCQHINAHLARSMIGWVS